MSKKSYPISITVKDRNEKELATLKCDSSMTVQDFKKEFLKNCEMAKKRKLYPARLRFTVAEPRGKPLGDT